MNKITTAAIAIVIGAAGLGSAALGAAAANAATADAAATPPSSYSAPAVSSQNGSDAETVPATDRAELPADAIVDDPGFEQHDGETGVTGAPGTGASDVVPASDGSR